MPIVCPAITGTKTEDEYQLQMERITPFAHRIQVDLADGIFSSPKTLSPDKTWWPAGVKADLHIMFKNPQPAVKILLRREPHLIIVHAEADGQFEPIAKLCHGSGVKIGIALLANTSVQTIVPALQMTDHVLIFSGVLGKFGGRANLNLLQKVKFLKNHKPNLEIGWDGGVNDQNVAELVYGGVDVLNVGGYIQNSDNPERAFRTLQRIADETGTT